MITSSHQPPPYAATTPIALAKPAFDTGPYLGSVAAKSAPPVEFTATKKRVTKLDIGSLHVTCSDGRPGTINLPGTPGKRSFKLTRGKFAFAVKASGADPQNAGTRLTGKLKGHKVIADEVGEYVTRVVTKFKEQRTADEQFREWVQRAAEEDLS